MAERDSILDDLDEELRQASADYLEHIARPYIESSERLVQQFIDTERESLLRSAKLLLLGQFRASTPSHSVTPYCPTPDPVKLPPGVMGRRLKRLHSWLTEQGIPRHDWHNLAKHGHTRQSIYDALKVYAEFRSEQGHGKPITPTVFERKFWQKQRLAKITPA